MTNPAGSFGGVALSAAIRGALGPRLVLPVLHVSSRRRSVLPALSADLDGRVAGLASRGFAICGRAGFRCAATRPRVAMNGRKRRGHRSQLDNNLRDSSFRG